MEYGYVYSKQEPEIGEIVASRPCDFYTVEISDFDFKIKELSRKTTDETITLLKYEGNGAFTEMYTGRIIVFTPIVGVLDEASTDFVKNNNFKTKFGLYANLTCVDFYQKYCFLKETPLLMGNFSYLDEKIYQKIGKQEDSREAIISTINIMFKDSSNDLQNSYYEKYIKEYELAVGEDIVYNFQHGINRKRMLKIETQENAE